SYGRGTLHACGGRGSRIRRGESAMIRTVLATALCATGGLYGCFAVLPSAQPAAARSEEHTSELQSRFDLVCRLLLEKKKLTRVGRRWAESQKLARPFKPHPALPRGYIRLESAPGATA